MTVETLNCGFKNNLLTGTMQDNTTPAHTNHSNKLILSALLNLYLGICFEVSFPVI